MPFTPFHMGPALAAKAVAGRHFSIPIYGFTQVAIDSQVLLGFPVRRDLSYHKVMHTMAGATAAALLAIALARPVFRPAGRWWNRLVGARAGSIWYMEPDVPARVTVLSALVGAWGHVLLDAPTHSHMEPLAPLARGNPLDGAVSLPQTMAWCAGLTAVGGVALWMRSGLARRGGESRSAGRLR